MASKRKEMADMLAVRLQRENKDLQHEVTLLQMRIVALEKRISRFYSKEATDERKESKAAQKKGS